MNEDEKKEFSESLDLWFQYMRDKKKQKDMDMRNYNKQNPIGRIIMEEYVQKIKVCNNEYSVLICGCYHIDHNIIFYYEEEENAMYCNIHLTNYNSFIKRLWNAIKYCNSLWRF